MHADAVEMRADAVEMRANAAEMRTDAAEASVQSPLSAEPEPEPGVGVADETAVVQARAVAASSGEWSTVSERPTTGDFVLLLVGKNDLPAVDICEVMQDDEDSKPYKLKQVGTSSVKYVQEDRGWMFFHESDVQKILYGGGASSSSGGSAYWRQGGVVLSESKSDSSDEPDIIDSTNVIVKAAEDSDADCDGSGSFATPKSIELERDDFAPKSPEPEQDDFSPTSAKSDACNIEYVELSESDSTPQEEEFDCPTESDSSSAKEEFDCPTSKTWCHLLVSLMEERLLLSKIGVTHGRDQKSLVAWKARNTKFGVAL
jgi:hypothetical protein